MKRILLRPGTILCGVLCLLLGYSPKTSHSFGLVPNNAGHGGATRKGPVEQPGASHPLAHAASVALVAIALVGFQPPALADEFGREIEMPFLDAGETVQICTKRGPLGKCEKTEKRTVDNENDKSEKYFRQPTVVARSSSNIPTADSEGNELIERLKKRSEENAEKNELLVYQRTLMNDSVSFFLLPLVRYG